MQRADSFGIGRGTSEKKDLKEVEEFDEAFDAVIKKTEDAQPAEIEEDQGKELAQHRDQHAKIEGERRGSSSPSHQPFLGMSILPGITTPRLAVGQTPQSHSKRRSAGVGDEVENRVEVVTSEVLQGLKEAGLAKPLVSLDDPRINGPVERLNEHFVMSLQGNKRVHVWNEGGCHQILTIGLHESTLESAVGTNVETVTRRGRIDRKSVHTRPDPSVEFDLLDDV